MNNNNAKPFLVLVVFVTLIALFAGGTIGQTDLTPDTPPAANSNAAETNMGLLPAQGVSGAGACGTIYTVQSGDTMSHIAQRCGLSLTDLLAANQAIGNANLIRPGQKINIVYRAVPQPVVESPTQAPAQPAAVEPTAQPAAAEPTTAPAAAAPQQPATLLSADPGGTVPSTGGPAPASASAGTRPGGSVTVDVLNFPPNAIVSVGLAPQGVEPEFIRDEQADATGKVTTTVFIPPYAKPGDPWVITVWTNAEPKLKVSAPPFTITQ